MIQDELTNSEENITTKKINIEGVGNRYLIKKVMKIEKKVELKKNIPLNLKQQNIHDDLYYLNELANNMNNNKSSKNDINYNLIFVKRNVEKKIKSYKQQDIQKGRFFHEKNITYEEVIEKLKECNLLCFYCNEHVHLYYDVVREIKQWTLDRINNDLGHYCDNVVIACLHCNLKRRRIPQTAFLFTRNLNIIKNDN